MYDALPDGPASALGATGTVPRSLEESIAEHVLDAIAEHRLKAGTKLGEQALSDVFGCSRAHVRRALLTLAAQKVVELKPNRGAFVSTPTPDEARNVFQARRAIEKTIARNAARFATKQDLARLKRHVEDENRARASGERREAIRLSGQFHLILAEVGRNDVLQTFLKELVLRSSLIIGLYAHPSASVCAEDDHQRLTDALASGNGAKAADLIDLHLRQIEEGLDFTEEAEAQDLRSILVVK